MCQTRSSQPSAHQSAITNIVNQECTYPQQTVGGSQYQKCLDYIRQEGCEGCRESYRPERHFHLDSLDAVDLVEPFRLPTLGLCLIVYPRSMTCGRQHVFVDRQLCNIVGRFLRFKVAASY